MLKQFAVSQKLFKSRMSTQISIDDGAAAIPPPWFHAANKWSSLFIQNFLLRQRPSMSKYAQGHNLDRFIVYVFFNTNITPNLLDNLPDEFLIDVGIWPPIIYRA